MFAQFVNLMDGSFTNLQTNDPTLQAQTLANFKQK